MLSILLHYVAVRRHEQPGGSCHEALRRHLVGLPRRAQLARVPPVPRPAVPRGVRLRARPPRRAHRGAPRRRGHARDRELHGRPGVPGRVVRRGRRRQQPARGRPARRLGRRDARQGARQRRGHGRGRVPRARRRHRHHGRAVRRRVQPAGDPRPRQAARRRARVQPLGGHAVPGQPGATRGPDRRPDPRRPRRRAHRDQARARRRPHRRHHHPAAVGRPRELHELPLRPRVGALRRPRSCRSTPTRAPVRTRTTATRRAG